MAQVMAVGYSNAKPLTPSQFARVKRGTHFMAVISEDAPARVPDLLKDQLLFAGEGHVQGAVNILGWKSSMNLFDLLLRQSIADQGAGKRHVLDQKTLDAAITFINRLAETAAAREAIARAA